MKYIIEIKPEYEGTTKGIIVLGIKNNCLCVDELAIEELEELNSDYINEHYGSLQDDAYQRGLDDAWEAAMKIAKQWEVDTDTEHRLIIDDSIGVTLDSMTASEAIGKLKAYEEQKTDELKVGDEVKRKNTPESERGGIVTKDWENSYYIMWSDGSSGRWDKDRVVKTGRHFDIDKILEEMRT